MVYKKNKKENILPPHESLDPISPRDVYTGIREMILERGEIENLINQHGEHEKMIRGRGDSWQTGRRGGPGAGAAASPGSGLRKRKTAVTPRRTNSATPFPKPDFPGLLDRER
jgi:hypothetical protein